MQAQRGARDVPHRRATGGGFGPTLRLMDQLVGAQAQETKHTKSETKSSKTCQWQKPNSPTEPPRKN
eukprot:6459111-Amphidinium_carterae.1